jgi:hypothetical protein
VNEHQLRRLLRRLVLLSAPLPLAVLGAACGGSTIEQEGGGGTTAAGGKDTGSAGQSHAGTGNAGADAGGNTSTAGAGGNVTTGGTFTIAGAGGTGSNLCRAKLDGQGTCAPVQNTVPHSCVGAEIPAVNTALPTATCRQLCPMSSFGCSVAAVTDSTVTVQCQPGCAVGRRPAGLGAPACCDSASAGSYFAEIAHLEAASVTAFRILRNELRAQGAPKKLVRAAARAARDEIRHARATGALARRFGATPRLPAVAPAKPRSLEAMALENAIEGCVRETYGALLATRQAQHAKDPVVRAAMQRIARDETRHASLSWRVDRWLATRLDPAAKRNVTQAKQTAAAELINTLANEAEVSFAVLAGLPTAAEATRLATEMRSMLWS